MEQQVHFTTLATPDVDAARRFYCDGLGWTPLLDVPGEIIFFQIGPGLVLGLFDAVEFVADMGDTHFTPSTTGITFSRNVDSPAAVDALVETAVTVGATLVKTPQYAAFGGYHGHFADPNGVVWEICFNPGWSVDDTGTVHLVPVEG